ncbi:hypothetical protein [Nonomuraea sp. KM90]|uniref:hypothetical protein n=1 Tax=Nonomuraea sp. KM90 TaxID=3457428 RepID=UPI003FCCDC26
MPSEHRQIIFVSFKVVQVIATVFVGIMLIVLLWALQSSVTSTDTPDQHRVRSPSAPATRSDQEQRIWSR